MYVVSNTLAFGGIPERKSLENPHEWHIINVSPTAIDGHGDDTQIPLNDGAYDGGNTQQEFAEAVNEIRDAIQSDERVFVHCAVGQSRSVSTLATAIAAEQDRDYDEVQDELMTLRGSFTKPAKSLRSKARKYLRHNTR